MILKSIDELIHIIQQENTLSEEKKDDLIQRCQHIRNTIQSIEQINSNETTIKLEKLNQLEQFETNNPKLTACIDIIARTCSRLGI